MPRLPKAVSEAKRERDLYRLYSASFRDIPYLDHPGSSADTCTLPADHVPRPAKDAALTAFAQLAAIRLRASRAMISLIDAKRQFILAEATPDISLRTDSPLQALGNLWLGSVSIPRTWGVCEHVLSIDATRLAASEDAAVIINDLAQSEHSNRSYVRDTPSVRFYAGVALTGSSGAVVGALCVFDENPRQGLPPKDILYLQDLAATIIEYLDTQTIKEQYQRGEQLTRGLISFAEGALVLQPFQDGNQRYASAQPPPEASKMGIAQPLISPVSEPVQLTARDSGVGPFSSGNKSDMSAPNNPPPKHHSSMDSTQSIHTVASDYNSVKALQESILPADSQAMFARAAQIIRASSDLDGVVIFDASATASRQRYPSDDTAHETESESSVESSASKSSSDEDIGQNQSPGPASYFSSRAPRKRIGKHCQILGAATREKTEMVKDDPRPEYTTFLEKDLARLFHKYPKGRVLHFSADGGLGSSTEDSDTSSASAEDNILPGGQRHQNPTVRLGKSSKAIHNFAPRARSIAFLPLWDHERGRWFAGCICWSDQADRMLSTRVDLAYYKVFGKLAMSELTRLDNIALNQAKTTFAALISHELRSPLHGILGTIQFMKESSLSAFQVTMLNSMAACGQTLLDTVNNILDHVNLGEHRQTLISKKLRATKSVRLSSKSPKMRWRSGLTSQDSTFDLALATEEVIEAVFAGKSYEAVTGNQDDGSFSPTSPTIERERAASFEGRPRRNNCFIVLDMAHANDWMFSLPAGSWRRILMNIFGNSLKYTESGFIKVSLRIDSEEKGTNARIILTITDSGSGMSPHFLADKAFQPFAQENPHNPGTGLGLSIVRQIIESIGGKIDINSDLSRGTAIAVKLKLAKQENKQAEVPQHANFLSLLSRLEGRRICILHASSIDPQHIADLRQTEDGLKAFTDALAMTLTEWLKMEVVNTTEWGGNNADIIIVPEVSFEYLSAIRRRRGKNQKAPVTIFVALDGLEAATLRSDVRVLSKESVVEIMPQPCGPYKLATLLDYCLKRYESPDENLEHLLSGTSTPRPHSIEGTTHYASSPLRPTTVPPSDSSPVLLQPLASPSKIQRVPGRSETPSKTLRVPFLALETSISDSATSLPIREVPMLGARILITDDNAINRKLLVAFMKKLKLRYQEAENGLRALQFYQDGPVRFDIILMDISMPVMDGMTATRAIREYESKHNIKPTCIVALTGLASASARLEAWNSGVDHFMTKPVNFKVLERLLRDEQERQESGEKVVSRSYKMKNASTEHAGMEDKTLGTEERQMPAEEESPGLASLSQDDRRKPTSEENKKATKLERHDHPEG